MRESDRLRKAGTETMSTVNLSVIAIEPRLLTEREAASYVSVPNKLFKAICSTTPIELKPGLLRWDRRDLDQWIDLHKTRNEANSHDAILRRLK